MSIASVYDYCWFVEKNLAEENKIKKLKKSAIYEGDLEEHWPFSGKEAEWTEKNLLQEHISVWEKTSLFIVKGERFYDYFSVTNFFEKNSNFLVTAPPPPPVHSFQWKPFLLMKAIVFICFSVFKD